MSNTVIEEVFGAVRVLKMNRPEARNALSGALISALYAALLAADADPDVNAIVLTGADPAFCAGVDLKEAAQQGSAYFDRHVEENVIERVALLSKPIIGAINGAAFTGGLEIALGCDFLIASERAVFADTHVRVGVLPGGGLTAHLPLMVGHSRARRMSMTGEVVDAAEALRIGLVTEVVAHDELQARAIEVATTVGAIDPRMMRGIKRMYIDGANTYVDPARATEQRVAQAFPPDLAGIEERRLAVMASNRAQLDR